MRLGRDWGATSEISDLIVDVDPQLLLRRPVAVAEVEETLVATGDPWGVRIVRKIRSNDGVLDPTAVDALLVQVHSELSRLGQEFAQPSRLRKLLIPVVEEIRSTGHEGPISVVDVGCGVGYMMRWLARHGGFGSDVQFVGCDLNAALIAEAQRLTREEGLDCTFKVADAFDQRQAATILVSSGVLHHFRGERLQEFFASHDEETVRAFLHYDVTPLPKLLRYGGSWTYHLARMRIPLSRHDGLVSAMRAHDDATLLQAAAAGAPWARVAIANPNGRMSALANVFRPVVGCSGDLYPRLAIRLGPSGLSLDPPIRVGD